MSDPAVHSTRRPTVSVRVRMLTWVIATAAIGIGFAGTLWYVVQLNGVEQRVNAALRQETAELIVFAREGVDPATGEPFATVERLFLVAAEREVPDEHQTFVSVVNGEIIASAHATATVAIEDSPELMAAFTDLPAGTSVIRGETQIGERTVAYAAARIDLPDAEQTGTWIAGYDIGAERAAVTDGLRSFGVIAAAALLVVALVGWLVVGRLLRPVRELGRTAQRISDTDLTDRIVVSGNDDISELGRTFNDMLDRLQNAFESQRDFLDDVGHELRTPLTIVRGHLELMDPANPEEAEDTRELVLDEVDRMRRLVDELVLLAKTRRPDFVAAAPVQLDELVRQVLEKARPLGDRDWRIDRTTDRVILADEQRLTQALLQLVANAVKFGKPGDVVALGAAVVDQTARLWVRDTGPGIAWEDQQRIFERFGRAATGRGVEGSGLGLAIVSAIAEAHGGRVVLKSVPGEGATVVLELPVDPVHHAVRTPDGRPEEQPAGEPTFAAG